MDDPGRRSTEQLREEAADAARRLAQAHRDNDMFGFHLHLGKLRVLADLIYDGNIREGKA